MTRTPPLVVIGHPKLPKGPARLNCAQCNTAYPAQQNTKNLVDQLGENAPEILCWPCAQPHILGTTVVGNVDGLTARMLRRGYQ